MSAAVVPVTAGWWTANPDDAIDHYRPGWAVALAGFVIAVVLAHPEGGRFPAAVMAASVFALVQVFFPTMRPRRQTLICPVNIAVLIYLVQLVLLPLSLILGQIAQVVLPMLPSDHAINSAILLTTAAHLAFAAGFVLRLRKPKELTPLSVVPVSRRLVLLYLALGMLAMFLMFGTPQQLLRYFQSASEPYDLLEASSSSVQGLFATLLRPFLQFAAILAWCVWADRRGADANVSERLGTTIAVVLFVAVAGMTAFFSRAAMIYPLIPIIAVYSRYVRRVSMPTILVGGVVLFVPLVALGVYRNSGLEITRLAELAVAVVAGVNLLAYVQLYGQAPQFLGFLIEQTGYGEKLYWGHTLIASILHPVPVVGRAFRESSGVGVYNTLIYGPTDRPDQVVPFVGELFFNLHVPAVLLGFGLVGVAVAVLQNLFERSVTAADAFMILYVTTWLLFLLHGSLAVVSQIALYSFWPVYVYWFWRGNHARAARHATQQLSHT